MFAYAVLAAIPVHVTAGVDQARDWIDYVTLAAAVFAALGTVGAVLVALFGPAWQSRRSRPALYVKSSPPSMSQSRPRAAHDDNSPATEFSFELGNAAGRETARDVEIFLSYARAVTEDTAIGGPQRLPLAAGLTVPPGFQRPATLLLLGNDSVIRRSLGSVDDGRQGVTAHHTVSFAVTSPWGPQWLDPDSYDITLHITGSNFDALRFDGALEIKRDDERDADRVSTSLRWEAPLEPIAMDAPRRRRPPDREELKRRIAADEAERRGQG
jgi:hypothetical protein